MQPNSLQGLYGAEYLQAASRYGVNPYNPYNSTMPSYNPAAARAMADLHRQKPKPKAKHNPAAVQAPAQAQPRQEVEQDIGDGLEENYFALVSTEELEKQGLRAHPDKIAEAAALSSVSLPAGSYKMCLPAQVIQGKSDLSNNSIMLYPHASCFVCLHVCILHTVLACRPYQCSTVSGSQAGMPEA